ncbi:MAG: Lrp/AsnC ligand binding domain-containing protein [Thaumarchaeota archaeon]|nr:Lrp/AsnC ligand binding domain-containing protein [Nitrososphaerota archaeon]
MGLGVAIGYVAIHCDMGRELETYERIVGTRHVKEASIVMGLYDIVCKIEAATEKEIERTVMQIRKIPYVKTTMTLLVL